MSSTGSNLDVKVGNHQFYIDLIIDAYILPIIEFEKYVTFLYASNVMVNLHVSVRAI